MRTALKIVYIAAFFAVCAFFSLGMIIPGASVAEEGAKVPALTGRDGINGDFGDEFENWFSKRFAFRSQIVSAFSAFREKVFATGNDQVTVGSDGFLFFNEALSTSSSSLSMTEEEIGAAADSLGALSEYSKAHGASFLFVCAPNKATVYPEMLPGRFTTPENDDLDRLFTALDERDVDYIDLRPVLASQKGDGILYFKRDTHWNGRGALAAFRAVADKIGIDSPDFGEFFSSDDFEGDLDRLLYPGQSRTEDDFLPDLSGRYVFTSAYRSPMDLNIGTRGGGAEDVLIFRDSYANALIPYFAASCRTAVFERANPYRISLSEDGGFDAVIVETAERNLRDLIGSDGGIG